MGVGGEPYPSNICAMFLGVYLKLHLGVTTDVCRYA